MNFFLSTDVVIEKGAAKDLLKGINFPIKGNIGCIYDAKLSDNSYFQEIKKSLSSCDQKTIFFENKFQGEPTYSHLEDVTDKFRGKDIGLIIPIGGGSTIDIGKGVALLLTNNKTALSLKGFPTNINDPISLITVPSLVGSGSEISFNAVFIDEEEKRKLGINSRKNFPKKTLIDPLLTATAPKTAILSSAMDSLVHCVDSFGSKKSTQFSRMFSIEGFKRTFRILLNEDIKSADSHEELAIGSICGITALMNSGDGPTNGFAYHLGVEKNIPHGLAGAIFLLEVMKYNYRQGYIEYASLNPLQGDMSKENKCLDLFKKLETIYKKYNIPKLSVYGYTKGNIGSFAKISAKALNGSFAGNPIVFNESSSLQVLSNLL